MKTFKDLFKSSHKQPLDIKPSIDDQSFEVSSSNWSSDSECHSGLSPLDEQSSKSSVIKETHSDLGAMPSVRKTLIQQERSELDNLDQESTNTQPLTDQSIAHSRRRKTPEEIVQHKNDYQREYCKAYRAKKKKEIEDMKELNTSAIDALINVLNANSQFINEADKVNINNTIDYYDRCRKIIQIINHIYGSASTI